MIKRKPKHGDKVVIRGEEFIFDEISQWLLNGIKVSYLTQLDCYKAFFSKIYNSLMK